MDIGPGGLRSMGYETAGAQLGAAELSMHAGKCSFNSLTWEQKEAVVTVFVVIKFLYLDDCQKA